MLTTIKNDIKSAMKNKEKVKLSTLRMLLSTIETERGKLGINISEFTEDQIVSLINRNIKALNQEIDSLVNAGRDTSNQEEQKEVLLSYLPKQLSDEEISEIVHQVCVAVKTAGGNIGLVMKELSAKLKGKADMGKVSKVAKETFNK